MQQSFLAPVTPLLRIIYSNCPTQNSGAICCPWEDLWIQILFWKKRKKEVYIPGRLLTNKGLIWNVPSVACEWARLVKIRLIWIFRAKYYLIAGRVPRTRSPVGQHMSPTTLKRRLTPFRAGAVATKKRHPTWRTGGLIPPLRSSRGIASVLVSAQSPARFPRSNELFF